MGLWPWFRIKLTLRNWAENRSSRSPPTSKEWSKTIPFRMDPHVYICLWLILQATFSNSDPHHSPADQTTNPLWWCLIDDGANREGRRTARVCPAPAARTACYYCMYVCLIWSVLSSLFYCRAWNDLLHISACLSSTPQVQISYQIIYWFSRHIKF